MARQTNPPCPRCGIRHELASTAQKCAQHGKRGKRGAAATAVGRLTAMSRYTSSEATKPAPPEPDPLPSPVTAPPEPVPPPTPAPVTPGAPAPASAAPGLVAGVPVGDRVEYMTGAARKNLKPHFDRMSQLVRVNLEKPVRTIWARGEQGKAGHFSPGKRLARPKKPSMRNGYAAYLAKIPEYNARVDAYNAEQPVPEFRIVAGKTTSGAENMVSVAHEVGHALDYEGDIATGKFATEVESRARKAGGTRYRFEDAPEDTGNRVHDFMAAAYQCESLSEWRSPSEGRWPSPKLASYCREPAEMWARAVAQWAVWKLDGDATAGQHDPDVADRHTYPHAYTQAEIERLAPRIEAVLRERGLLVE